LPIRYKYKQSAVSLRLVAARPVLHESTDL